MKTVIVSTVKPIQCNLSSTFSEPKSLIRNKHLGLPFNMDMKRLILLESN